MKPQQKFKLREATLHGIAKYIEENDCKNIITMAGAGLSTSVGIPDMPTLERWFKFKEMKDEHDISNLMFFMDFFREFPIFFFIFAKSIYKLNAKPTLSHYFIKILQDKGLLLRHFTKNFDSLERKAGIHAEKLIEVSGSLYENSHCINCSAEYDIEWLKEKVLADEIPRCSKCGDIVAPDIGFTGFKITTHHPNADIEPEEDFRNCDLLIIMGTRLIYPYSTWINWVPDDCPRLLINNELVGKENIHYRPADRRPWGFDPKGYDLDIFWEGKCDDGCELLADELGWGNELRQLMKEANEKFEKKSTQMLESAVSVTRLHKSDNNFLSKIMDTFVYYWRIYVLNRIRDFFFMGKKNIW